MHLIPLAYILAPIDIYWYNYRKLYTYQTVTLTLKEYTPHIGSKSHKVLSLFF